MHSKLFQAILLPRYRIAYCPQISRITTCKRAIENFCTKTQYTRTVCTTSLRNGSKFRIKRDALSKTKTEESNCTKAETVLRLQKIFKCNETEAENAYNILQASESQMDNLTKTLKWFKSKKVSLKVILENCGLLLLPLDKIESCFSALQEKNWRCVDDLIPFLSMDESQIISLRSQRPNCFSDRVYEIAEAFSLPPCIISQYCAKHPFILYLKPELFNKKLKLILNYNLNPQDVLCDLDLFRHSQDVLEKNLRTVTNNGIERIVPWMVKCPEKVFKRLIELRSQRCPDSLRNMDFLSMRFQWHGKTTAYLFKKNRFLSNLDLEKTAPAIEILLKNLTPAQIIENIELLKYTLPEIERRIIEIKKKLKLTKVNEKE